jgi:hypothetical protein
MSIIAPGKDTYLDCLFVYCFKITVGFGYRTVGIATSPLTDANRAGPYVSMWSVSIFSKLPLKRILKKAFSFALCYLLNLYLGFLEYQSHLED